MDIKIYSNDPDYVLRAISRMELKGFSLKVSYRKSKYWFFGEVTYYAVMTEPDLPPPFAPGGIMNKDNRGEFIASTGGLPPAFIRNITSVTDAMKELGKMLGEIDVPEERTNRKELNKSLEEALDIEDYETAAKIRDRLAELKK